MPRSCRPQSAIPTSAKAVKSVTLENRLSLWGYKGNDAVPFIKVTLSDNKSLPKARDESSAFPPRLPWTHIRGTHV